LELFQFSQEHLRHRAMNPAVEVQRDVNGRAELVPHGTDACHKRIYDARTINIV